MLITQQATVSWNNSNKAYYTARGYVFTGNGTPLIVPIADLVPSSTYPVQALCPTCGVVSEIGYSRYLKRINTSNCANCVGQARKTIDFIRDEFEKRGYTLVTDVYINAHQHLTYRCSKHPEREQQIIYNSLQRGRGCTFCGKEVRGKKRALTEAQVLEVLAKLPYEYISHVIDDGSKSRIYLRCPIHNREFSHTYNSLQQGFGCVLCGRDKVRGVNNVNYKGETLYLSQYVRSHLSPWKLEAARQANYVCELTGLTRHLADFDVHHTESSYNILVQALREQCGVEYSIKTTKATTAVIDKILPVYIAGHTHVKGAFICHGLHKLYHAFYGHKDTIAAKYEEFAAILRKDGLSLQSKRHTANINVSPKRTNNDQSPYRGTQQNMPCI